MGPQVQKINDTFVVFYILLQKHSRTYSTTINFKFCLKYELVQIMETIVFLIEVVNVI